LREPSNERDASATLWMLFVANVVDMVS